MSIFVSIAAYRDPQLLPTIRDCLAKARQPDNLHFGVCWQHTADEPPLTDLVGSRFRILDVDWRHSRGACWARAQIMKLWDGEQFFLQLDSHHRFVQDWDVKLLEWAERTAAAKPIITTYGAPFAPNETEPPPADPMRMDFDRFTEDGIALFRPTVIPDWRSLQRPLRARFLSAHFLFTAAAFIHEVPYDEELYFLGEEITLTIRAFTHGYDLFHAPEPLVWHEYTRSNRAKHWDDHVKSRGIDVEWHVRDAVSRAKVRQFLATAHDGPYGCGTVRTFADYEAYAGLNFQQRRAEGYTLRGDEPPNPPSCPEALEEIPAWDVRVVVERNQLPATAVADPQFWYVGFHDCARREIHREDACGEELRRALADGSPQIVFRRRFRSHTQPVTWTVWPFSRSGGWLEKFDGRLDQDRR